MKVVILVLVCYMEERIKIEDVFLKIETQLVKIVFLVMKLLIMYGRLMGEHVLIRCFLCHSQ